MSDYFQSLMNHVAEREPVVRPRLRGWFEPPQHAAAASDAEMAGDSAAGVPRRAALRPELSGGGEQLSATPRVSAPSEATEPIETALATAPVLRAEPIETPARVPSPAPSVIPRLGSHPHEPEMLPEQEAMSSSQAERTTTFPGSARGVVRDALPAAPVRADDGPSASREPLTVSNAPTSRARFAPENGATARRFGEPARAARVSSSSGKSRPDPSSESAGEPSTVQPRAGASPDFATGGWRAFPALAGQLRRSSRASPAVAAPDTAPVINVSIGRVEVRAVVEKTPARPTPVKPTLSLESYLNGRNKGRT